MKAVLVLAVLVQAGMVVGCAAHADIAMRNASTGVIVGCERPNDHGTPGDYLTSRACISACQAHGFRPILGEAPADTGTPTACLN